MYKNRFLKFVSKSTNSTKTVFLASPKLRRVEEGSKSKNQPNQNTEHHSIFKNLKFKFFKSKFIVHSKIQNSFQIHIKSSFHKRPHFPKFFFVKKIKNRCNNFWPLTSLCDLAGSHARGNRKHNHNLYHQSVSFQVHWFRLFQADWVFQDFDSRLFLIKNVPAM